MPVSSYMRLGVVMAPLVLGLAGCGALDQKLSSDDRSTLADCRAEADRQFAAQNRDQLSERDSSSSPNSGAEVSAGLNAGLGDHYKYDSMVDACLARHGIPARGISSP